MTVPVALAPPVTSAPPRPPNTRQVLVGAVRSVFAGTPGRLRSYGAITVTACLVFGVSAFVAATTRADALSNARSDAAQLVRIQAIRTNLVSADASLTNAFLIGGLEPAAERSTYESGIATASRTLAEASGAKSADAAALAIVTDVVTTYTGLVESARADNRQGFPIGAAYLRQATNLLRSDALPTLENVGTTEQKRVDDAYSASASAVYWLVVGLLLAVAALAVAQVGLARRTRRVFNLPLLTATGVVVVMGIVLVAIMTWSQSKARTTRSGAYFATVELATARIDAFDAKSAESLTLISRGSGQAYQARYAVLSADAKAILSDAAARGGSAEGAVQTDFAAYDKVHTTIRAKDDGGNWQGAVDLATGTGSADANALFAAFDKSSAGALGQRSKQLRDDLGSARAPLVALGWIALVAGVAAAGSSLRGISNRLREYR